ncbi:MAG: hypothetical protein A2445_04630 [Candidatus Jacksonbacteria bacterium RIFOXYC2_FULL_44_29]|nr:MAG: Amidophosphoribosyltransferase-like protein [Parcubacteria group bacterium GW2011_GWA2_42_28]KKT53897.1 MAG: Amidophosphoribosyltransferase-like protein [Parcubacteria group bacterium GW2011_GWC2_44_22]OGY75773.1 MAG: hypothetical protein A2295_03235 [Candidatus Jacksonbacteria bacterium RIFOXYB2_FULL_44_15]OGY76336.1 MAG: hypothetical protein A2240_04195 [Candidatus Jacksonbacteria bacterium RIFOXYA2_FULL_43_12]OGY78343.1 MAG: hypothetical protein A2445_04630 [Candidatus Jacksonbacteri
MPTRDVFRLRQWRQSVQKIYQQLLDLLFPIACLGCNANGTFLCKNCQEQLPQNSKIIYATSSQPDLTSEDLAGVLAASRYQDSPLLQKAIYLFKYKHITKIGELLAPLLAKRLAPFLEKNPVRWLVIPIPLHQRKLMERGFNQNDLLAAGLQTFPELRVLLGRKNPLKRLRYTQSQTKLKSQERLQNVKGIFSVIDPSVVQGQNILIVDDLLTTGATLRSAAQVLKQAGARQIWGLVLAQD